MNKIIVIGNLGRDPEMQYTPSGQAVTRFNVASNRKYTTGAGEQREETELFNCSALGKLLVAGSPPPVATRVGGIPPGAWLQFCGLSIDGYPTQLLPQNGAKFLGSWHQRKPIYIFGILKDLFPGPLLQ